MELYVETIGPGLDPMTITWLHIPPTNAGLCRHRNCIPKLWSEPQDWVMPPTRSFLTCKLTLTICPLPTSGLSSSNFLPAIHFYHSPESIYFIVFISNLKTTKGLKTTLVGQMLRFCAPNAGGLGSIPGQETRSHMLQLKNQKNLKNINNYIYMIDSCPLPPLLKTSLQRPSPLIRFLFSSSGGRREWFTFLSLISFFLLSFFKNCYFLIQLLQASFTTSYYISHHSLLPNPLVEFYHCFCCFCYNFCYYSEGDSDGDAKTDRKWM